jgi:molecular chaperone HscB
MDHFARLGLPAALDLEPASLDRAYFALQRQWHPDRFVAKPAA